MMNVRIAIGLCCCLLGHVAVFAEEAARLPTLEGFRVLSPEEAASLFDRATADLRPRVEAEDRSILLDIIGNQEAADLLHRATTKLSRLDANDRRTLLSVIKDKEQPPHSYAVAASILILQQKLPCPLAEFERFVESDIAAEIELQPPYTGDGWPGWFQNDDVEGVYYLSGEPLKAGGAWVLLGTEGYRGACPKSDTTTENVRVITVYFGKTSRTISGLSE